MAALVGVVCNSFSGVFYVYAAVSPSTGTFYRAVFGLPILVFVALGERPRHVQLPRVSILLAALAGVFFTGDLMFWHHTIEAVGAGLGTVLGNLLGLAGCWLLAHYQFIELPKDVFLVTTLPVRIEPGNFMVVATVSVFMCVLAALSPARRAARLVPVEVIRYE